MDSLEILLRLRRGDSKIDHGYWFRDHSMKNYCPNHYLVNEVCPNCLYTEEGESLVYLREKEYENSYANI